MAARWRDGRADACLGFGIKDGVGGEGKMGKAVRVEEAGEGGRSWFVEADLKPSVQELTCFSVEFSWASSG